MSSLIKKKLVKYLNLFHLFSGKFALTMISPKDALMTAEKTIGTENKNKWDEGGAHFDLKDISFCQFRQTRCLSLPVSVPQLYFSCFLQDPFTSEQKPHPYTVDWKWSPPLPSFLSPRAQWIEKKGKGGKRSSFLFHGFPFTLFAFPGSFFMLLMGGRRFFLACCFWAGRPLQCVRVSECSGRVCRALHCFGSVHFHQWEVIQLVPSSSWVRLLAASSLINFRRAEGKLWFWDRWPVLYETKLYG